MNYMNLFRIAIGALVTNKMRAILTMLGIVIGVASVIAMLAIGEGSKQSIREQMSSMGTNMIIVVPITNGASNIGAKSLLSMKYNDVITLRNEAVNFTSISPEIRVNVEAIYGNENTQTTIHGVSEEYFNIRKLEIKSGRIFNSSEIRSMSKVCLLGQTAADNLFGEGADPVGMNIRIKKVPFRVIGVLKKKGENGMGIDLDDCIIAPYTTVQRRLAAIDYINGIYASAISGEKSADAIIEMEEILRRTHKIKESEEDNFAVMSQSELIKTVSSVNDTMTYLLGAIAGISLLVGGIGIMNIMYVSVTERTREIGLRMSVGGRNRDIMKQFLVESMLLSIMGGLAGIVSGYLISEVAGTLMGISGVITARSVVLAFVVCFAIGVFFGWYPARKASNLNPIDALRYE
jgi:putative ABC transport system permease protein